MEKYSIIIEKVNENKLNIYLDFNTKNIYLGYVILINIDKLDTFEQETFKGYNIPFFFFKSTFFYKNTFTLENLLQECNTFFENFIVLKNINTFDVRLQLSNFCNFYLYEDILFYGFPIDDFDQPEYLYLGTQDEIPSIHYHINNVFENCTKTKIINLEHFHSIGDDDFSFYLEIKIIFKDNSYEYVYLTVGTLNCLIKELTNKLVDNNLIKNCGILLMKNWDLDELENSLKMIFKSVQRIKNKENILYRLSTFFEVRKSYKNTNSTNQEFYKFDKIIFNQTS